MNRKEMNKGTYIAKKKKFRIEKLIWNWKLEKRHCHTSTGRRHRSYEQGGRQSIDVKV